MSSESKKMKLEDLGYDAFFETNRNLLKLDDFLVARVTVGYKGAYKVKNENGEYLAKITGKQMFNASSKEDYPAVGDWVAITVVEEQKAVIHGVLPRRTVIKRKSNNKNETQIIATNIDVVFVVESVDRDFNLNRIERYFAITKDCGIKSVVVLNKIDLISEKELDLKLSQIKNRFSDVKVISTSVVNNKGLEKLKSFISSGKTYCFLGSSGVGKSSLINRMLGESIIKTEGIGVHAGRGKHITTKREMYFLDNGGIVIDNPGMREVGMTDMNAGIDSLFDEITTSGKKCKYSDCTHTHEPGCGVLSALETGELDEDKYTNYITLKKEAEFYKMTKLEKREKGRRFGKFIKNAKKDFRKNKP